MGVAQLWKRVKVWKVKECDGGGACEGDNTYTVSTAFATVVIQSREPENITSSAMIHKCRDEISSDGLRDVGYQTPAVKLSDANVPIPGWYQSKGQSV